jgi:hypothetical protein
VLPAAGADNIGAPYATGGKTLRVYVNGTLRGGNPAAITFAAHDEIALIYGTPQHGESVPQPLRLPGRRLTIARSAWVLASTQHHCLMRNAPTVA